MCFYDSHDFRVLTSYIKKSLILFCFSFLASGIPYRRLAYHYRIGTATVSNIIVKTCSAIWTELVNIHMPKQSVQNQEKIANDYFELWGFPTWIGSIDGKHCRIKCLSNTGFTRGSGSTQTVYSSGSRWQRSSKWRWHISLFSDSLIESDEYNIPPESRVPGSSYTLPYVLIGDEAYPLKTNLLRPFPSTNLTVEQKKLLIDDSVVQGNA